MKRIITGFFAAFLVLLTTTAGTTKSQIIGYWEMAYVMKEGSNEPRDIREMAFYFHEDGALELIDLRGTNKLTTSWKMKSGNRLKIEMDDNDFKKPVKILEISDQRMVWEFGKGKIYFDRGTE